MALSNKLAWRLAVCALVVFPVSVDGQAGGDSLDFQTWCRLNFTDPAHGPQPTTARANQILVWRRGVYNRLRAAGKLALPHLVGASLVKRDLRDLNLPGADLRGLMAAGSDMRGANLEGASLYGADLPEADLRGASLALANLRRATLAEARLDSANLAGVNRIGPGTDTTHTDLRGAWGWGVNLRGEGLIAAIKT